MKTAKFSIRAEEALLEHLNEIPFIIASSAEREPLINEMRPDLLVKLAFQEGEQTILVEIKENGQPRNARAAVNQLLRYKEYWQDAYLVFIAPHISPESAEICKQEGVGYLDLAGNCFLSFKQVYVRQEGKPNLQMEKRELRSLYSPKSERALRVLLIHHPDIWKTHQLAKEADISLGSVANIKKLLTDREWVSTLRDGFTLNRPEQLLFEWADNYRYDRNNLHDFYSLKSTAEIERDLAQACHEDGINCAFTGFSGAARFTPFVRYNKVTAYVDDNVEGLVSRLNLRPVSSGANVTLIDPYDEGVFYDAKEIDGIPVVSTIQLYLDLRQSRGRGDEAANKLYEQTIMERFRQRIDNTLAGRSR